MLDDVLPALAVEQIGGRDHPHRVVAVAEEGHCPELQQRARREEPCDQGPRADDELPVDAPRFGHAVRRIAQLAPRQTLSALLAGPEFETDIKISLCPLRRPRQISTSLVGVIRAAGESTRLRLLALLAEGEHSVKDLTEILGQSQPRVSRHLKLLADAGLVTRNAEGAWAYYGLAEGGAGADLAHWLIARLDPADADRARDKARLEWVRAAQQRQAAEYFAKVAESWDALRNLHVPESAVEAAIVAAVGSRQIDMLFDLGTGTGRMLELLNGHYRRAIGIDSEPRDDRGGARKARRGLDRQRAGAARRHRQSRSGDRACRSHHHPPGAPLFRRSRPAARRRCGRCCARAGNC